MGLFSRKPGLASANVPQGWTEQREWLAWDPPRNLIRGESHYQKALRTACGMTGMPRHQGYLKPVSIDLIREPHNEYDRNAFAAFIANEKVGYLAREIAAQLAPALDKYKISTVRVCGVIRGGSSNAPSLGIHVWLDRRPVAGHALLQADSSHIVPWPPFDGEGQE